MNKIGNRKILSAMLTLAMLLGVCTVATAADSPAATKNSLRSQGAIRYQEGTESVVIDSADLYTLADRMDLFKVRVAQQLGLIGTYLSRNPAGTPLTSEDGVYAVHQKPSASGEVDPLALSFESILEGIAVSQTIPMDPASYGMGSETTLYKGADGKLGTSYQEGAEQICIQPATAENLSAGTAAWVNGHLILGTGGDNKTYHDLGYQDALGGQGSDEPGDVNRARVIDMTNGSDSYIVQEDMSEVFLFFAHLEMDGGLTTPILSSGESIKLIQKAGSGNRQYNYSVYYIPKLTKGTVISNLHTSTSSARVMSMLITVDGSKKNEKVNGIHLSEDIGATDYIVQEDMTDVFLFAKYQKDRMPDFIPMNDQEYVPYKLIKEVCYKFTGSTSSTGWWSDAGCLYYIPKLKAGTRISNTKPSGCYLVY